MATDLTSGTGIKTGAKSHYISCCAIDCTANNITNAVGAAVINIPAYHSVEMIDVITTTCDTGGAYTLNVGISMGGTEYISAGLIGTTGTAGAVLSSAAYRTVAGATAKTIYIQPSATLAVAQFIVVAQMRDLRSPISE